MEAISGEIKEIIAEQLALEPADVKDANTFDDLCADSLDLIEIAMTVEDRFFVEIPDELVPNEGKTTVADFIALVANLKVSA